MISVEEAKNLIIKHTEVLGSEELELKASFGRVLFEDITSPIDLPPFDQSAMDGYTFLFSDLSSNTEIKISGEIPAGVFFKEKISSGKAVRIFTGAAVPRGADTVVMQEKIEIENGNLIIQAPEIEKGSNIRLAGSQIKKNSVALKKGSQLTPGGIGFLAAMGIAHVRVYKEPAIALIITGSELQKPGTKLMDGQIYESNSFALQAVLRSVGIRSFKTFSVEDDENKTLELLKQNLKDADLIIFTGGISVGDYDFVGKACEKAGIENIFYKVSQKPGKPLFFGKHNKTLVYGLPGNPAAVLSCFYEYVYPGISMQIGKTHPFLPKLFLPIAIDHRKKAGLSLFLKGKIAGTSVIPLKGQESYILSSFAEANCMIYIPAEKADIEAGELVEVHLLPQ